MSSVGPAHGSWCNARTYPTKCRRCGERVFYFSCDCGCKVFFNRLGWPWPEHDRDRCWADSLVRTVDDSGRITVRLSRHVTVSRPPEFPGIEPELVRRVEDPQPSPIIAIQREAGLRVRVEGILREITTSKDPFRAFGLRRGTIGAAMLGAIGRQPVGQITVHVPSPGGVQIESYTAWVPTGLLEWEGIERGLVVLAELEAIAVGGDSTWFCNGFGPFG